MATIMTWDEMKQVYPDEWLLIVDFEVDEYHRLTSGVVLRHSPSKDVVYAKPAVAQPTAFRYTGESTFSGLRSHAAHNHTL